MTVLGKPLPKPQPVGLVREVVVRIPSPASDSGGRDAGWSKVEPGSIQSPVSGSTSAGSDGSSPTKVLCTGNIAHEAGSQGVNEMSMVFGKLNIYEDPDEDFEVASTACPSDDAKTSQVTCAGCKDEDKWKRMLKLYNEDKGYYYECAKCVMTREALPDLRAAQFFILKASPGFLKKSRTQAAWQDAKRIVQDEFKMMKGTRKEMHSVTHATMRHLFAPLAKAIARKHRHMEFLNSNMEIHKAMMERMRTCTDPKLAQLLLEELDKLMEPSQLLAFQGENQWQFQLASTYSDEYVSDKAAGTYMRFFFVCLGGGDNPCMTILESKEWEPKSGIPLNPNGWRCKCGTNYKTKFGVICEIMAQGYDGILYCKAPVPDEHVNDVRAIMHELKIKPDSPKALYDAVPVCKPSTTSMIISKLDWNGKPLENQWTFKSKEDFYLLPTFDWYQVFNLSGYELPPKPLSKKQKKAQNAKEWEAERLAGVK
jgi:hypothetical protein